MNNSTLHEWSLLLRNKLNLATIGVVSASILLLGLVFSVIILWATYQSESLGNLEFCLNNKCVEFWIKKNKAALLVLATAGSLIIGLVTVGGIVVALLSYQNSANSSAVTNHLSHLNVFMNYVHGEADRRSRLSKSEIETLKWYNLIYSKSISGDLAVSDGYLVFMDRINSQIQDSNSRYSNSSTNPDDKYKYKDHQIKIIEILEELGIYLERLPRIDFNEVEIQVFELIETVNLSFCRLNTIPRIQERSYH